MALSVPPLNMSSSWDDADKSSNDGGPNTNGLGLVTSGMSLMPSYGAEGPKSPDVPSQNGDHASNSQHSHPKIADSGDSVHSQRSSNASPLNITPSGPAYKSISRPPGLVPSPTSKPGHMYSSSASTAQTMTLTPTSSLDGGSDPFGFDAENDGLHGLQALRDRSHSLPGPINVPSYTSSPPVRNHIGSFQEDTRSMNLDQRRPRAVSRDGNRPQSSRPPLSGISAVSPHGESNLLLPDRNLTAIGVPFSGNRSRDPSPTKAHDSGAPRVIARPDVRYPYDGSERMVEYPRRQRVNGDTVQDYAFGNQAERSQISVDQLSNKFGQLPSLNAHMQQQLGGSQAYHLSPQGPPGAYQRSSSMPNSVRGLGLPHEPYQDEFHHPRGGEYGQSRRHSNRVESDYSLQHSEMRYNGNSSQHYGQNAPSHLSNGRSRSMAQGHHRAGLLEGGQTAPQVPSWSSLQSLPTSVPSGYYGQTNTPPRRESIDFIPGNSQSSDLMPVATPTEDMRIYASDNNLVTANGYQRHGRHLSPAQSPRHIDYGGHSRLPSSIGSSPISSSPLSFGSGSMRHGQSPGSRGSHYGITALDDDLAHPLIGENIDVPADDQAYLPSEALQPRSHLRSSPGHGRKGSVEKSASHYSGVDARHLPTAGSGLPLPKNVYNVKFKRTQRNFVIGPRLNRDLKVGTYVKVEADRGEDLGIVVGKIASDKCNMTGRPRAGTGDLGITPPSGAGGANAPDLKRIIRLATHDEVSLLQMKREEEDELLKVCRQKVRQRALSMNVVDAEYQFDRHKLTFFFEAEGRVDFRELVRDLFSMYKTRIWMQQLDKNASVACTTETSPAQVVVDHGTPIIAPASEFSDFAAQNTTSGDDSTD